MIEQIKLYLDVCCLNRPFDDWTQPRIRLEAEAVLAIIDRCQAGEWLMVVSTALESEIAQTPESTKRQQVMDLLAVAKIDMRVTEEHIRRAKDLQSFGYKPFDALHIACAEAARVDAFLTTDDRLLRKATTQSERLRVRVANPVVWIMENNFAGEGENDDSSN
ncbi:MAG: PIN domain-containing protein [Hydrococcus sp. Prado102]|jgi:predicted nucleic acid-binding protein|nr:PIN domain-containing protein [Hydrococcus sp. Prado102]